MKQDMKQEMQEIILTEKDYEFIDHFCEKYSIRGGSGYKRLLSVFLNEYKNNLVVRIK